mgnify:CR=1 FL=1
MKIGLIIYGSLDTISGGYLYDRKLVEYLRSQGDSVEIFSLPWTRYGRHLTHNFSRRLLTQLQNATFDVLLQDELNHPSLFWLNRQLRGSVSYPIISIVHHLRSSEKHPALHNLLYRQIEKTYLRSVDGFIFNSQTTKQVVENLVGQKRPFVVAYPAGDRFQQTITAEGIKLRANQTSEVLKTSEVLDAPKPLQILFVGNLIPRKGLHNLITTLTTLPKTEWHLHVVGSTKVDINYTRKIKRQIETAVLTPNITFHHTLADEQLAQQMAQSHILVMPSQYEGFGIVYLEGMGFGLPAIGSTSGAAWEMIQDGENGFLVDAEDTAVLAQRIQHLHQNRDQLLQMSLAAQQTYQQWPTWERSMQSIRTFLLQQIGN